MLGLNRISLVGRLVRDSKLVFTPSGKALLELRVAVNEQIKRDDTWQDHAEYFDAVVLGKRAEALAGILAKGTAVMIEGPMRAHRWEARDGSKRTTWNVTALTVLILHSPRQQPPKPPVPTDDDFDELL